VSEPLRLRNDAAEVEIVADRGGLVSRFAIAGAPVLFLDDATLRDRTKNVRGGVPVLFPTPGKLAGDAWRCGDASGALPQHWFARNEAWRVAKASAEATELALAWPGDPARWPWPCELAIRFALSGRTLRMDHRVTNNATTAMPFGLGFHPYFAIADGDKARARVVTTATRAFDNATKRDVAITAPIDLTAKEVDLHLLDHGNASCTFELPGRTIALRGSPEFTHWVVWTLAGKDFVCVEPWTCPGNALNTGDRVITLEPGASRALWLEIEAS